MPNIDDFKAQLRGGGARANLFRVIVNYPPGTDGDSRLSSFMIKGATLPESTNGQIEIPFRGRKLKLAGDKTFNTWTVTVINDTGFEVRDAMERWHDLIQSASENRSAYSGANALGYMYDITVEQLDADERVLKSYDFRSAWPLTISAIDLNYETNDTIEEFTCEFAYQYWESNTTT